MEKALQYHGDTIFTFNVVFCVPTLMTVFFIFRFCV